MNILPWNFSLSIFLVNREKSLTQSQQPFRIAGIKNPLQLRLYNLWASLKRHVIWLWKTGHTSWTLHALNRPPSCRLRSIQLSHTLTKEKKVSKSIRESRFVLKHQLLCEWFLFPPQKMKQNRVLCLFQSLQCEQQWGGGAGTRRVLWHLDVNLWGNSFSLQNCKF